MERFTSLRNKEVIDASDCKRLGFVCDVDIDVSTGNVSAIIVPGRSGLFGSFGKDDYIIPWKNITKVGDDIIIVTI